MTRLIVLLRGINVSGRNKVPMADLRKALSGDGFENVATYIQSGNIAIDTEDAPTDVADQVQRLVAERFDVEVPLVVLPQADVVPIADAAPFGPDDNPSYSLIYFAAGEVDVDAVIELNNNERYANDTITGAANAVYVLYDEGQSKTKLTLDALEKAAGTSLTGRNVRSTEKLKTL